MGQTLSEPVTVKHTSTSHSSHILYAVSSMQGWRISMEDAHTTLLTLTNSNNTNTPNQTSFFAVYDGHGGKDTAEYAGTTLHKHLTSNIHWNNKHYIQALKYAFLECDIQLRLKENAEPSGCTACTLLIDIVSTKTTLYIANAGDSRCVLSTQGIALDLSTDHKPTLETEITRIRNAGGFVEFGRVNGNLALSRALGDLTFKENTHISAEEQIVTADPEIVVREWTEGVDEFIVIACDGIWDCLSSQDVVDYVRERVVGGERLERVCEGLMEVCLAPLSALGGVGCDNMTVMVVVVGHEGGEVGRGWKVRQGARVFNTVGNAKSSMDKSSMDKSSVDKSSVDKSSMDKSSVDKSSVDKSSVVKSSVVKSSVVKSSVVKSSMVKSSVVKSRE